MQQNERKKATNIINPAGSKILLMSSKNRKQQQKKIKEEIAQRNFPELKSF